MKTSDFKKGDTVFMDGYEAEVVAIYKKENRIVVHYSDDNGEAKTVVVNPEDLSI